MAKPHLILVAGPPASGKTTLARQLAAELCLPLICKDTLKESLFEHLGSGDREWSMRLGQAVICGMYALAEEILNAGASLILESTFNHPNTPDELRRLIADTGAQLSVVYCYAESHVLAARYNARVPSRHPGHLDQGNATPAEIASLGWLNRPDYPGEVILVDTTDLDTANAAEIVRQIHG